MATPKSVMNETAINERLIVVHDGVEVDLGSLSESDYATILSKWHRDRTSPLFCGCAKGDIPLSVCMRGSLFYLRAYPNTKWHHDTSCCFFALPDGFDSTTANDKSSGSPHDLIRLSGNLSLTLKSKDGGRATKQHAHKTKTSLNKNAHRGSGHTYVDELGLLNELWKQAGLNTWPRSEEVSWLDSIDKLKQASEKMLYNQCLLSDRLAFMGGPGPYVPSSLFNAVADEYRNDKGRKQRFFIIGAVSDIKQSLYGREIVLRGSKRRVYCRDKLADIFNNKYPLAIETASARSYSEYCVALLRCYWSSSGRHLKCDAGALMSVDYHLLPFDSADSRALGERLVTQGRRFVKILPTHRSKEWMPNFVLTDTNPITSVEIISNTNSSNDKLTNYCDLSGISQWKWVPGQDKTPPKLPLPSE